MIRIKVVIVRQPKPCKSREAIEQAAPILNSLKISAISLFSHKGSQNSNQFQIHL